MGKNKVSPLKAKQKWEKQNGNGITQVPVIWSFNAQKDFLQSNLSLV